MLKKSLSLILLFFLICSFPAHARETVTISGFVMDMNSRAIELVKVSDHRSQLSTTTDIHGFYSLTLPKTDTVILSYSCLSYQTATRIIPIELQNPRVNVTLSISSRTLKEVTVKGQQRQTSTLQTLDVSNIRMLPDASGGSIEALLVTFAGVSSNNELSSQYSVRGGNYDENLVYVNGTEVYRPLLIRAGQQEGLSFINPEMVKEVKFSSGGFDAKYGDKMSSVLDIEYKQPKSFEAVASGSLLGANLYL
ncbi:MAG: carboxypeptidase-like regulatory domain-containing protein, partial [Bacteroidota bacterium]|nr:carboxypeptidase-like regulatory domain-containing protein [Bacteroidota bacterium]